MAQFIGTMRGNRGEASRLGTKASGITAHIRGWNVGVQVSVVHENGEDRVYVYKTSGSNGRIHSKLLASFTAADLEDK